MISSGPADRGDSRLSRVVKSLPPPGRLSWLFGVEEDFPVGDRLYLAALSPVDLPTACDRLRVRFALPEFVADVEVEGDDWWEYAHADGPSVGFNLTRVGRFADTAKWGWMWGAPDRANYQVIVRRPPPASR